MVRISLKQAKIHIPVKRNFEAAQPNPRSTGTIIRGLSDRRDPQMARLYEDTLASLLDLVLTQAEFNLLTQEEIDMLQGWHSDNERLTRSRHDFLLRFNLL